MLEIIPGILTEQEFRFFNQNLYDALIDVMDDVIASYLLKYMENPEADKRVLAMMEACCGDTVRSLTFHKVLRERGTLELISKLTPEAVAMSGEDYTDTYNQLKFLEQNRRLLLQKIPKRTYDAYQTFLTNLSQMLSRMNAEGVQPHYPDIMRRVENNRFLFYVPNDKGHGTYASIVVTRENSWTIVLRGIEYREYCDAHHIDINRRSVF